MNDAGNGNNHSLHAENCQSSTGYLWFTTSSDGSVVKRASLALDFALAQGGSEIIGTCDPSLYILNNTSMVNAASLFPAHSKVTSSENGRVRARLSHVERPDG